MPLLFLGQNVLDDDELASLRLLVSMLDDARAQVDEKLANVEEESPLHESADDLAGLGFVACQKYLTAIAAELGVRKDVALAAGPRCSSGGTLASLVSAAANAWKHQAEWREPLTGQQVGTVERLGRELADTAWDYKFVNALFAAAPSNRFCDVVDGLVSWRDDLLSHRRGTRARSDARR